jgi:Glycosyltransferase
MKILHIGEYVKGGVSTYISTLLEYQKNQEDISETFLLLSKNHSEKNWPLPDTNIFYYEYKRRLSCILPAIYHIYKHIKMLKPDIIHIHSSWAGLFVRVIYFFTFSRKAQIVYCSHGWSFLMETSSLKKRIYSLIEFLLALKTDAIINISQYEHSQAILHGLPKEKMHVIYNGLNDIISSELRDKDVTVFDKQKINLLFVGRFDRQKGLDILIKLFEENSSEFDNINLYVIGEPVVDQVDINIPPNVTCLGWVNNSEIDAYYKQCDAVIIPSRWEGFGLVALEAMRNKKAVIASDRGALPELVKDRYNGYLFELNQKNLLVNLLKNLDKHELSQLGKNGYLHYKENFNAINMNQRIASLYRTLMRR